MASIINHNVWKIIEPSDMPNNTKEMCHINKIGPPIYPIKILEKENSVCAVGSTCSSITSSSIPINKTVMIPLSAQSSTKKLRQIRKVKDCSINNDVPVPPKQIAYQENGFPVKKLAVKPLSALSSLKDLSTFTEMPTPCLQNKIEHRNTFRSRENWNPTINQPVSQNQLKSSFSTQHQNNFHSGEAWNPTINQSISQNQLKSSSSTEHQNTFRSGEAWNPTINQSISQNQLKSSFSTQHQNIFRSGEAWNPTINQSISQNQLKSSSSTEHQNTFHSGEAWNPTINQSISQNQSSFSTQHQNIFRSGEAWNPTINQSISQNQIKSSSSTEHQNTFHSGEAWNPTINQSISQNQLKSSFSTQHQNIFRSGEAWNPTINQSISQNQIKSSSSIENQNTIYSSKNWNPYINHPVSKRQMLPSSSIESQSAFSSNPSFANQSQLQRDSGNNYSRMEVYKPRLTQQVRPVLPTEFNENLNSLNCSIPQIQYRQRLPVFNSNPIQNPYAVQYINRNKNNFNPSVLNVTSPQVQVECNSRLEIPNINEKIRTPNVIGYIMVPNVKMAPLPYNLTHSSWSNVDLPNNGNVPVVSSETKDSTLSNCTSKEFRKTNPFDYSNLAKNNIQIPRFTKSITVNETEDNWICLLCKKRFSHKRDILLHYKSHKEEKVMKNSEITCPTCYKIFSSYTHFTFHVNRIHQPKDFYCDICKINLQSIYALSIHNYEKHPDNPYGIFTCYICKIEFDSAWELMNHIEIEHKKYFCKECKKEFYSEQWYNDHKIYHIDTYIKCENCNLVFESNSERHKHILLAHPSLINVNRLHCQKCNISFPYSKNLYKHNKLLHEKESFVCDICNKSFSRKRAWYTHVNTVHTEVLCNVCGKSVKIKSLKFHMFMHSGKKPYKCKICGKCFTQRSTLTTHIRYHTGEKPYKCSKCGRGHVSSSAMKTHLKSCTSKKKKRTSKKN